MLLNPQKKNIANERESLAFNQENVLKYTQKPLRHR